MLFGGPQYKSKYKVHKHSRLSLCNSKIAFGVVKFGVITFGGVTFGAQLRSELSQVRRTVTFGAQSSSAELHSAHYYFSLFTFSGFYRVL